MTLAKENTFFPANVKWILSAVPNRDDRCILMNAVQSVADPVGVSGRSVTHALTD